MTTYYVAYLATASFVVEVEIDDAGMTKEQAIATARELADDDEHYGAKHPGSLCHQCARTMDVGDFEQDTSEDGVWPA